MWHDHLFSQRNMTAEKTVRWELEVTGKWGWGGGGEWTDFEKGVCRLGNIGGGVFIK